MLDGDNRVLHCLCGVVSLFLCRLTVGYCDGKLMLIGSCLVVVR